MAAEPDTAPVTRSTSAKSCLRNKPKPEAADETRVDAQGNIITKGGKYVISFRDLETEKPVQDVKEVTAYKNTQQNDYDGEHQRCVCSVM